MSKIIFTFMPYFKSGMTNCSALNFKPSIIYDDLKVFSKQMEFE